MIALKTIDLRNDVRKISQLVNSGERVLISRPHNANLVIISEKEFNELDKARRNAEYLTKIDNAYKNISEGHFIVKTMDELEEMAK